MRIVLCAAIREPRRKQPHLVVFWFEKSILLLCLATGGSPFLVPSRSTPHHTPHLFAGGTTSSTTKFSHPFQNISSYNVGDWTAQTFNMDLYNVALEDPARAEDAVAVWSELSTPNAATYTILIEGYLHVGDIERAEALLWEHWPLISATSSMSSTTCMVLLTAWANHPSPDGARRAEQAMRRLMELTESSRNTENKPEATYDDSLLWVKLWTIVIEAYCKRVSPSNQQALTQVERLIAEMSSEATPVQPNLLTYTSYIVGLAHSRRADAARKAQEILDTKIGDKKADLVAYTAVMNAWAKTVNRIERREASNRALRLLDRIEANCQPNAIAYATAIAAIGNTVDCDGDAAALAESILERMKSRDVRPVTETYNTLLHALGQLSDTQHADRAWELLQNEVPQPTVRTWAGVLRATRGDAPAAAAVLEAMQDLYENGKAPMPNTVCYTTVMGAWGKSSAPDAIARIKTLLDQLEALYEETGLAEVRPSAITYLTVRNELYLPPSKTHFIILSLTSSTLMR